MLRVLTIAPRKSRRSGNEPSHLPKESLACAHVIYPNLDLQSTQKNGLHAKIKSTWANVLGILEVQELMS